MQHTISKFENILSIIIFAIVTLIITFVIAFFSINGEHNREGYTFVGDFFNGTAKLTAIDQSSDVVEIPSSISFLKVKELDAKTEWQPIELFSIDPDGIFENDDIVKEIIIPEGVEKISEYAINDCDNLEMVSLPNSMQSFQIRECNKLDSLFVPNSVKDFLISDCNSLKTVEFSDENTVLEECIFYGCNELNEIIFPQNIGSIHQVKFEDCSSLSKIILPEGLESIGEFAFSGCTALKSINLPKNIKNIYSGAFYGCKSMERISINDRCTQIDDSAFDGCDKLTIYGIKGSYAEQYANEHNIPFKELNNIDN